MGRFRQIVIMNRNRLTNELQLSRNIQRIIQEVEPMRVSFYCDALKRCPSFINLSDYGDGFVTNVSKILSATSIISYKLLLFSQMKMDKS